jgi:uncharacterized protein YjbJ (UPF0337 family)
MNRHVPRGMLKQLKGETKKQWGKLTDDDYDVIAGQKDQLIGKAEEGIGHMEDKADREYDQSRSAPGD